LKQFKVLREGKEKEKEKERERKGKGRERKKNPLGVSLLKSFIRLSVQRTRLLLSHVSSSCSTRSQESFQLDGAGKECLNRELEIKRGFKCGRKNKKL
jgi:hypothetical protein